MKCSGQFGGEIRLLLRKQIACAMMLIALALTSLALNAQDLTGTYSGDDGAFYYLQQVGNTVWWAGLSVEQALPPRLIPVWHRGLGFTNVFRGAINSDNTITGEWADVTRGSSLNSGTLTLAIGSSGGVPLLTKMSETGGFGASAWLKTDPLDDTRFLYSTSDIINRFNYVVKNDGSGSLEDNLKAYRDQTVFYGRVITSQLQYLNNNQEEEEIPHVNYGPLSLIPHYPNFGQRDRDFESFLAWGDKGDADFDVRIKIDLDKLEPDFWTTGWGNRTSGPQVFNLKLNDANTHQKLNLGGGEAYMGAETIMGQIQTAINILAASIYEVQAQVGKHISNTCHDPSGRTFDAVQLLLGDLQYLQGTLAAQLKPNSIMALRKVGFWFCRSSLAMLVPLVPQFARAQVRRKRSELDLAANWGWFRHRADGRAA